MISSNKELFYKIHPKNELHDFENRKKCLRYLRIAGYQVGTGFMINLPGQTYTDMANDILFLKKNDIDMIGMGPYIPHLDTPMGQEIGKFNKKQKDDAFTQGLKMIALARITLKDVNIAATTALQALNSKGRELGVKAGANIIMPNVTETEYRPNYQLYEDKPGINENSETARKALDKSIAEIGEKIGYNEWGDSKHFAKRTQSNNSPKST